MIARTLSNYLWYGSGDRKRAAGVSQHDHALFMSGVDGTSESDRVENLKIIRMMMK